MTDSAAIRPSWWYGLIGLVFALSGIGLFVFFIVTGILHLTDSLTQVIVPGQTELTLTQSGTYTIFLEENSVVNGRVYSATRSISGLKCSVREEGTSAGEIPVRRASSSITYSVGGRSGRSVLEFPVTESGQYRFGCDYQEGAHGPEVVVAVGTGVGERIGKTVLRSLMAMFGGGALCAVVIVGLYFMRERSRKQLAVQENPPGNPIAHL